MKIGILTLPLHTNYGGVLQAYALQYSLRSMGHVPYLIDTRKDPKYANLIKLPLAALLKPLSRCCTAISSLEHQMRADKEVMRQHTEAFIKEHIAMRHYRNYKSIAESDFDAIVVGSDQVWRPEYFKPITAAYLDFAAGWKIKRVAYAVSFGLDEWSYNQAQGDKCKVLISLFDAVSVREDSGVKLCKEYLNCSAVELLDPTMLVPKQEYIRLVELSKAKPHKGGIMVSLLDSTPDKELIVRDLSAHYNTPAFSVNSRVEDRSAPLEERIQPPIEQWLRGFMDAEYVVTDSFHAMVFAIIFNKPFVAYANQDRGYTRFLSLLSKLGLEAQFITSSSQLDVQKCFDIEWGSVNEKLDKLRARSLAFISSSLASNS